MFSQPVRRVTNHRRLFHRLPRSLEANASTEKVQTRVMAPRIPVYLSQVGPELYTFYTCLHV